MLKLKEGIKQVCTGRDKSKVKGTGRWVSVGEELF